MASKKNDMFLLHLSAPANDTGNFWGHDGGDSRRGCAGSTKHGQQLSGLASIESREGPRRTVAWPLVAGDVTHP